MRIQAGERGGYRVYVEVYKELEDLARPTAATGGGASFREMPTVDRRVELVAPIAPADRTWIPAGRDLRVRASHPAEDSEEHVPLTAVR